MVMGGIMSLDIPAFLQAWNHLNPVKWSLGSLAPYSLRGVEFTCTDFQRLPGGGCPINTGEEILKLYRLDGNAGLSMMALGLCVVGYRTLAYGILKAKRTKWEWKARFGKKKDTGRMR